MFGNSSRSPVHELATLPPFHREKPLDNRLGRRLGLHQNRVARDLECEVRSLRDAELIPNLLRNYDLALGAEFAFHSNHHLALVAATTTLSAPNVFVIRFVLSDGDFAK